MVRKSIATVDDYIAAQPEAARPTLERVRSAIRRAVPAAEESLSYNIPTYKLNGKRVLYFAGWKGFYSVYPANATLREAFAQELEGHEIVKSTVHFSFDRAVPVKLIEGMAKFRAREILSQKRR